MSLRCELSQVSVLISFLRSSDLFLHETNSLALRNRILTLGNFYVLFSDDFSGKKLL